MLCNACLMQRRLRDEPDMQTIVRLDRIAGAKHPAEALELAWEAILEKDYAPVFRPALAALAALPERDAVDDAVRSLAECANRVADSLSELGYDHAGPLYHKILGSARSDGAFYTNNLSALMLARLAFPADWIDWTDPEAVENLRVIDPACGTGTLLMATLRTIKARVGEPEGHEADALHKHLVENTLCGLDINQHAVQLAACNMTLGAPTVDYARMNLLKMPHGPQPDGTVKSGSVELLVDDAEHLGLHAPKRSFGDHGGEQVSEGEAIRFPLRGLDGVIMNAPFTDNRKRGRKFGAEALKAMQRREVDLRDKLKQADPAAGGVITTNSIRTFFTPMADRMIDAGRGVLAKVIPVTACVGASGTAERRFLAERFHVERIVTSHDPKRPAFSEGCGINESLLVCRRHPGGERPPTQFVSLRAMPDTVEAAIEAADTIASAEPGPWGSALHWPADRVRDGDWTPAQWYDGELAKAARALDGNALLEPAGLRYEVGPAGQRVQDAYQVRDGDGPDAVPGFHSVSSALRRTLFGTPDVHYGPRAAKLKLAERYRAQRGQLLVTMRHNTVSGRLTGLWTGRAVVRMVGSDPHAR